MNWILAVLMRNPDEGGESAPLWFCILVVAIGSALCAIPYRKVWRQLQWNLEYYWIAEKWQMLATALCVAGAVVCLFLLMIFGK
jgi:uncharacterized membrane protein YidH (DUF202 family)